MGNIISHTSFGGRTLFTQAAPPFDGAFQNNLQFQIGASASETMSLDLAAELGTLNSNFVNVSAKYTGNGNVIAGVGTELTDPGSANLRIDDISATIAQVGKIRSTLGATANRLQHAFNNLSHISTNTKAAAAAGRIMDVDFAAESANMTANQMLMQAGSAMLKQSNSTSSMVMSLLQ